MRRAFNIQLGKFVSKTGSNLVPEVKHYAVRSALNANRFAIAHRGFSTNTNTQEAATPNDAGKEQKNEIKRLDYDEYDDYEVPNDPKSKTRFYAIIFGRLLLLGGIVGCAGFLGYQLLPTRLSPTGLFSEVFDFLRYKEDMFEIVGSDMKAFGRDVGRSTEGRRNHVDSYSYTADDGSKRLRIRFNIKGEKSQVLVWAEVSDKMNSNEYVYVIVKDLKNGNVKTIVDNRDQLEAGLLSNGNDNSWISSLLKK